MRNFLQVFFLSIGVCTALPTNKSNKYNNINIPIDTNTIQRYVPYVEDKSIEPIRALKKVFLSNRSITCNDGSQAGFYLRQSYTSKKWIIFLEGGWYCYDYHSCRNRWLKQRHYMTSANWPDSRNIGGILSGSSSENPFWWNANHVFVPYCTSDSWSGLKPSHPRTGMFSFMGAAVVQQVVKDILQLGLENSTDLLLAGSSAGGTGAMLNLDPVQELLHDTLNLKHISVKGVADSGWFLDRIPYTPTVKPAVDAIRKGVQFWNGQVPKNCKEAYKEEPWRCYFGYRLYPHLKTDLFVFQWLFDEAQMDADNVGAPVTKQQWDYVHKMGDALRQSFENVTAVFAPSCISHSILTKKDWQDVRIDDISVAEAIHCWEQKVHRRHIKKMKNALKKHPKLKKLKHGVKLNNSTMETQHQQKRKKSKSKKNRKRKVPAQDAALSQNMTVIEAHNKKGKKPLKCGHRKLERCSWPQCNHSCPRLHNPFTGEEMNLIELLKSFGLDMQSVAKALGIDMQTLNNMDHSELLKILTQQKN